MEWYVIQVPRGREEATAEHIGRVVPADILNECFYPRFATEIKVRGRWIPVEKPLFPGYLVGVTSEPEALDRALLDMQDFARVLKQGDVYLPLARDERGLIESFTKPGNRLVPMSMGIKQGDSVLVMEGPLVGRQGLIRSINRRKSIATLELNFCGRPVMTRVGLGILTTPDTAEAKRAAMYVKEMRLGA